MDKKEFNLVVQLRKDARRNLSQIGRIISMPVSTVHDRMKRIKDSVIKKYTCILDFRRLGFNTRAHLVLRLSKKEGRHELKEYMLKHQNINSLYKINNGYDFLAELVFRDLSELDSFVENLEERFKIREKKIYYIIGKFNRASLLHYSANSLFNLIPQKIGAGPPPMERGKSKLYIYLHIITGSGCILEYLFCLQFGIFSIIQS